MPRYTFSPQGTWTQSFYVPAVATGSDLEWPLCRAPFDGYLSAARITGAAAYTGAATNYRSWRVRNKFSTGTGALSMAVLDGLSGTNLTAFLPTTIPLVTATPAAPAYSVQPTPTPTTAPVLSAGTGALTAGVYRVAYSFVVNGVEGPLSPYADNVQDGSHGIAVAALTNVPPGVTSAKFYYLVSPGTAGFVVSGTGAAVTLNAQGNGTLPSGYAGGDVTAGDSITLYSLHVGTGLADPGGSIELTFTRS